MARDPGLEDLLAEDLDGLPALSTRAMFGGLVWLYEGHLLCGARQDGLLLRLGAGQDGWALALPGVTPMRSAGRPMTGWVWVGHEAYGDDAVRRRLIEAALAFVRALPPKAAPASALPWEEPGGSHSPTRRRRKA